MAAKLVKKQSRNRAFILGLGVVAAVAVFLWLGRGPDSGLVRLQQKIVQMRTFLKPQQAVAIAPVQVEQKIDSPTAKLPPVKDEVSVLNDQGVDLVLKKQYWPGVFLFKQAIELNRSRIEPIMNMAVTLDEMGLSRPAARYLAMAEAMDPEYPPLRINRQNKLNKMLGVHPEHSPESPNDKKR
jgi:hypothetical protein